MKAGQLVKSRAVGLRACCVCAILLTPVVLRADGAARALEILITNDDGFHAPGIEALRTALRAAGHRVTVVAPEENQSAASWRITTGPVRYRAHDADTWVVDGSPADAVAIGLRVIYADRRPDLVVSGANLGQNVGATANVSGTIGAALMAEYLGVPAIAVSVGVDLDEKDQDPPFPSSVAAFPACARIVARLVGDLAATAAGGPLLPSDAVLNVNCPVTPSGAPRGVRIAASGRYSAFSFDYVPTGRSGEVRLAFTAEPRAAREPDTDTQLFAQGYVTISVIDGDLAAREGARGLIESRLEALTTP